MTTHNPKNERIKRAYFAYLREAKGLSETSIDQVAKAVCRFESYTRFRDFREFHIEQAKSFKQHLVNLKGERTGEPLSKATIYATLMALKAFFGWLAGQPGYKSRISYGDTEYFNMPMKDARIAKAVRAPRVPTLEQIRRVLQTMPAQTEIERRDRAVVAFAILTGARDGAIASLKLKHIDLDQDLIEQDAREVRTKASKSFPIFFFPVGDDIRSIVVEWVNFLRTEKLFGSTILYSRLAVSRSDRTVISGLSNSITVTGQMPGRFAKSSRGLSRGRVCRTLIRTRFGRLWHSLGRRTALASSR